MTDSPTRKGWRLENKVQHELLDAGYTNVCRSPLSRGCWDVRGTIGPYTVYIQVKRGGYVSPAAWNQLYDFAEAQGAHALVAYPGPRGSGIQYRLITGRKAERRRQPWTDWELR